MRLGDTWYFVTFDGKILPIKTGPKGPVAGESWSLLTAAERKQGWRPGGVQQLAIHGGTNRLYSIMHRGSRDTHKDPGKDIWVYDLTTHQRVQKITTRALASSIQISTDDHPLLFSIFAENPVLDIYDPVTGALLHSVPSIGTSPMLLLTP